tara:strand:+ start:79 stop:657 length:579 start_codon:yes stop_codon:yes gene_type:complete
MWRMWCQASKDNLTLRHHAFQRKAAFETNAKGIVIGWTPSDDSMKWDNPPLRLFAIPPLIGLISAFIGFQVAPLFGFQEKFVSDIAPLLLSWFTLIVLSSILMFTIPAEWGEPKEMRYGVLTGVIVVFIPQICGLGLLLCALWFLAVILGWVFVSTYQWKYEVQPFRTGLWLGVGGLAGMFMGSWAMSVIIV